MHSKLLPLLPLCAAALVAAPLPARVADAADDGSTILAQAERNILQYRQGDIRLRVVDAAGQPVAGVPVLVEQRTHHFRFGSIIFELLDEQHFTPEQRALFQERFAHLFNLAVFPFYWDGYEPVPGRPEWQRNLRVAEWARSRGILCKGHPLAWTHPAGMPAWLRDLPPETATTLLKARIVDNVKGFAGTIDLWDVVNEPSNTVTWDTALRIPDRVEDARYDDHGPSLASIADWVEPCYRWAHAANPQATLLLNDFGQIARPYNRKRFFELVQELQRRGTPLHGIGLQAHEPRSEWFHPRKVWDTLERYRKLGLPIHFTEFHPHSLPGTPITGGFRDGQWSEESQAEFARQMYTLAFGHPSVVSFTWWDFTENDSYIKGSALLNKDFSPKPAYRAIDELINRRWKTHTRLVTDANGCIALRGFYGDYDVRPEAAPAPAAATAPAFHHVPGVATEWTLRLER